MRIVLNFSLLHNGFDHRLLSVVQATNAKCTVNKTNNYVRTATVVFSTSGPIDPVIFAYIKDYYSNHHKPAVSMLVRQDNSNTWVPASIVWDLVHPIKETSYIARKMGK